MALALLLFLFAAASSSSLPRFGKQLQRRQENTVAAASTLKQMLDAGAFILAPGVFEMFSARIADEMDFKDEWDTQ